MDLGEVVEQEGDEAVSVAVAEDEQAGLVLVAGLDDVHRAVAAHEHGVFVLLLKEAEVVELALDRAALGIARDLEALGRVHEDLHRVRVHPGEAGGRPGRAVELLGDDVAVGVGVQRGAGEAHALGQCGEAVISAEAGPVVVGAVEDVLILVRAERRVHVHVGGVGLAVAVVDDLFFAVIRRIFRQEGGVEVGFVGDECEVDLCVRVPDQRVERRHVGVEHGALGPLEALDERAVLAEVHVVVLLLAEGQLAGGLEGYPLVAEGELVGGVGLKFGRIVAAEEALEAELGPHLEIAVLLLGELAVGQYEVQDKERSDEGEEDEGFGPQCFFVHAGPSLEVEVDERIVRRVHQNTRCTAPVQAR